MPDLTDKFTALEAQLSSEHTAVMDALTELSAQLDAVATNTDLALVNGAVNTRALLQAIGANNPCGCSTPPSLVVPPLGSGSIGVSSEQCQRIQAFLHTVQEIVTTLDAVSTFSISLDFTLLNNSINEVVTSIESGSDLPVISFPEGVQLVGDTITYAADNLLVCSSLSAYFASVLLDLRGGMALGTSATNMQALYNSVIDASALPSYVKPVLRDTAYRALYTYYFDTGTTPNLTGYDGSLCGGALHDIGACQDFPAVEAIHDGHTFFELQLPVALSGHSGYIEGDFFGWSFQVIAGTPTRLIGLYYVDLGGGQHLEHNAELGDVPYTSIFHSLGYAVQTVDHEPGAEPFTIRICPPS